MTDVMYVVKLSSQKNAAGNYDIAWQMSHSYAATLASAASTFPNWRVPDILHQDNNDRSKMYLMGRLYGKAAVI